MPRTSEMIESKFLKKEDVGIGALVTVKNVLQKNVAAAGAGEEMKWCAEFEEFDKPLVLNSTNIHAIETISGSDNTDDWSGTKVVLYNDPNVSYAGRITGGIRIRAPRKLAPGQAQAAATNKPAPIIEPPDDLPF